MFPWISVYKRELADYFYTPVAYVFLVIFLAMSAMLTFYFGDFIEREQADLSTFFQFHPWLYLIFTPALGMRLWSEERKSGTIQTLLTLPVSVTEAVVGKFLAAWTFAAVALAATMPIWLSVNYLGSPDNGVIIAGYLGSLMMAGAFLSISSCASAMTKNQVVAFVLAVVVSLLFMVGGLSFVQGALSERIPYVLIETIAAMSFLSHFELMVKGVLEFAGLAFFASTIVLFVYLSVVAVDAKKGN